MSNTIPGGYYIGINGKAHDANGKEIVPDSTELPVEIPAETPVVDEEAKFLFEEKQKHANQIDKNAKKSHAG